MFRYPTPSPKPLAKGVKSTQLKTPLGFSKKRRFSEKIWVGVWKYLKFEPLRLPFFGVMLTMSI